MKHFFGSNDSPAQTTWQERALYKQEAMAAYDYLNLSDFWYKNPFYGKIDKHGYAIAPLENCLAQYKSEELVLGLDFVVGAYESFYQSFLLGIFGKGGVKNYNSVFVNMQPKSGWVSASDTYHEHQERWYEQFFDLLANNITMRKKICNFDSFLNIYFWFLDTLGPGIPITKPGFIRSKYCSPNISGLIVEIDDTISCGDDNQKKEIFLNDPLFDFFVKKAAAFGFSVDKNVPWRLVARLNTARMKYFMSLFNTSYTTLFNQYYVKAYLYDYEDFKLTAQQIYNSFVAAYPEEVYTGYGKQTGKFMFEKKTRYLATDETLDQIKESMWLKKYYYFRLLEKGKKVNRFRYKRNMKKIMTFYRKQGLFTALDKLEQMCIAIPKSAQSQYREEMYDYGFLNTSTVIYTGKENKKT